MYSFLKKEFST